VSQPQALVDRASALCATYGAFLFLDHAYAAFAHDGARLATARGPHVFCGFSFSKAYGMAGWRVGVLAHPPHLGAELLKVRRGAGGACQRPAERDRHDRARSLAARAAPLWPTAVSRSRTPP
jgi:aspartate/methionine/tyrosine aminotransferase